METQISSFVFQISLVFLLTNMLVNVLKPLWQSKPWQSTADLVAGFTFSIGLCLVFHVDGITLLAKLAFPNSVQIPWYIGSIITGAIGEKLAALLNDLPKGRQGRI